MRHVQGGVVCLQQNQIRKLNLFFFYLKLQKQHLTCSFSDSQTNRAPRTQLQLSVGLAAVAAGQGVAPGNHLAIRVQGGKGVAGGDHLEKRCWPRRGARLVVWTPEMVGILVVLPLKPFKQKKVPPPPKKKKKHKQ